MKLQFYSITPVVKHIWVNSIEFMYILIHYEELTNRENFFSKLEN